MVVGVRLPEGARPRDDHRRHRRKRRFAQRSPKDWRTVNHPAVREAITTDIKDFETKATDLETRYPEFDLSADKEWSPSCGKAMRQRTA